MCQAVKIGAEEFAPENRNTSITSPRSGKEEESRPHVDPGHSPLPPAAIVYRIPARNINKRRYMSKPTPGEACSRGRREREGRGACPNVDSSHPPPPAAAGHRTPPRNWRDRDRKGEGTCL